MSWPGSSLTYSCFSLSPIATLAFFPSLLLSLCSLPPQVLLYCFSSCLGAVHTVNSFLSFRHQSSISSSWNPILTWLASSYDLLSQHHISLCPSTDHFAILHFLSFPPDSNKAYNARHPISFAQHCVPSTQHSIANLTSVC